nr:MAG TPA: hypothetical protein [Microviridae sp.]
MNIFINYVLYPLLVIFWFLVFVWLVLLLARSICRIIKQFRNGKEKL